MSPPPSPAAAGLLAAFPLIRRFVVLMTDGDEDAARVMARLGEAIDAGAQPAAETHTGTEKALLQKVMDLLPPPSARPATRAAPMRAMERRARAAYALVVIEETPPAIVGDVLSIPPAETTTLVAEARRHVLEALDRDDD